jgi:NAD(P)-dependent dehydrogenase (short-subunit alcohol dehydrogenase family)
MRDVEGRVAFITGGGSGVGLGMARAFLGEFAADEAEWDAWDAEDLD